MFTVHPIEKNKKAFVLQYKLDNKIFDTTVTGASRSAVVGAFISMANTYVQYQIETLARLLGQIKHHYEAIKPPMIDEYANWITSYFGFRQMLDVINQQGELTPEKTVEILTHFNYDFQCLVPLHQEWKRAEIRECVDDIIKLPRIIHRELEKQKP